MMKIRLILAAIFIVLLVAVGFLSWGLAEAIKDKNRYKTNLEAAVKDKDVQQQLTYKEFKYLYDDYVKQINNLKEYGVKLRNVENLIHVNYVLRDSVIYRDTLVYVFDTIREEPYADFDINAKCWHIKGNVCGNVVEIEDFNMQDSILILLYKEKKKCLFERTRVKAIAYSYCTGDTLSIINNLKLRRHEK